MDAITHFQECLNQVAKDTEIVLDRLLAPEPASEEIRRPPRLLQAMRYASLGAGKRFRPFLVVESAGLFGVSRQHALMAGARRLLAPSGVLYLYGPFKENGRHTAPSNAAFDASLRARDPDWGVRDLADVRTLAGKHDFDFAERVAMPANNLSVVFRRRST